MNAKTFEQFSPRDQEELGNVLVELQRLDLPKHRNLGEDEYPNTSFASYDFFLGRAKQFRITRIK